VRFSETSPAKITGMAGELTWRPRLGQTLQVGEASRGGQKLSTEITAEEIEVVTGASVPDEEIWQAFGRDDLVQEVSDAKVRATAARKKARPAFLLALLLLLGGCVGCGVGERVVDEELTVQRAGASLPAFGGADKAGGDAAASGPGQVVGAFEAALGTTYNLDASARNLAYGWAAPEVTLVAPSGAEHYLFAADFWKEGGESSTSTSRVFTPAEAGRHTIRVEMPEATMPSVQLQVRVYEGVWMVRYLFFGALACGLIAVAIAASGGSGQPDYS
jgi:hypothetical protein